MMQVQSALLRLLARGRVAFLAALLAAAAAVVNAHGLSVALQPLGDGVGGQAVYADGAPARGDTAMLYAATSAQPLASAPLDADGRFRFALAAPGAYRVVIEGDEGHRAEARIDWAPPGAADHSGAVLAAVRAELAPLREDIARLHARTRLADVIGGLGLIIGVFAGWGWWRAQRRR